MVPAGSRNLAVSSGADHDAEEQTSRPGSWAAARPSTHLPLTSPVVWSVSQFRQSATTIHLDTTPTEPGRHGTPVRYRHHGFNVSRR